MRPMAVLSPIHPIFPTPSWKRGLTRQKYVRPQAFEVSFPSLVVNDSHHYLPNAIMIARNIFLFHGRSPSYLVENGEIGKVLECEGIDLVGLLVR